MLRCVYLTSSPQPNPSSSPGTHTNIWSAQTVHLTTLDHWVRRVRVDIFIECMHVCIHDVITRERGCRIGYGICSLNVPDPCVASKSIIPFHRSIHVHVSRSEDKRCLLDDIDSLMHCRCKPRKPRLLNRITLISPFRRTTKDKRSCERSNTCNAGKEWMVPMFTQTLMDDVPRSSTVNWAGGGARGSTSQHVPTPGVCIA